MVGPGSEGGQVGVVGGGGVAHAPLTAGVEVAEVVRHLDHPVLVVGTLQGDVVPQQVVVGGLGRALDALVAGQEEGELVRVSDGVVNTSAGRNILILAHTVLGIHRKQPGLVSLLSHDVGDGRLPVRINPGAGAPDGHQLNVEDGEELALRHPVTVENDPSWSFPFIPLQKSLDQLLSDLLHAVDHLLVLIGVLKVKHSDYN